MYRTAICDECGDIVYWCDEVIGGWDNIEKILKEHPEWYVKAFEQFRR